MAKSKRFESVYMERETARNVFMDKYKQLENVIQKIEDYPINNLSDVEGYNLLITRHNKLIDELEVHKELFNKAQKTMEEMIS